MSNNNVAIIPTRVANIASMIAALRRAHMVPNLESSPDIISSAPFVVLPGVGTFGAGMNELISLGLVDALKERIAAGRKTLAVCVGMQLLGTTSQESPEATGLNIFDSSVTRFPDSVRIPQFGWNKIEADSSCRLLTSGYAYFANSFRFTDIPEASAVASSNYGGRFVAALENNGLLACQFHPELSGKWGQQLINRWLQNNQDTASC